MSERYIIDDKLHIYESAAEKHLIEKTVTLNGTYKGSDEDGDINGYSEVTVNVEGGGSATLIQKSITENGVYTASSDNADGYSKVTVNVESSPATLIQKSVTENGVYTASSDNADGYSKVTVNVPSGGSSLSFSSNVTEYEFDWNEAVSSISIDMAVDTSVEGGITE